MTPQQAAELLIARGLGGPWSVKPLHGGYWNQIFHATRDRQSLVLKHYGRVLSESLFPNLPQAEALALHRLSGAGVAPQPVAFWEDAGVLVYNYVEGKPWSNDLTAVARLLLRKEAVSADGFRRVPIVPHDVLAEGDALFARCAEDGLVKKFHIARPLAVAVPTPKKLSLIHTDIGATNLIGEGKALRLIDWQCPAQGDLVQDIYSFLSPAFQILNSREPLTALQRASFFFALGLPDVEERYHAMEPFYAYRMAGYCCLRRQTDADKTVQERYRRAAEAELPRLKQ